MAWEAQMIEMVRVLVDDLDTPPRYSDSKLERVLMVAAYNILQETRFESTYVVDIPAQSVEPDPVDNSDVNFVNLWVLKACCIVLGGEYKTQSLNAISVRNGPSSIDMRGAADSALELYKKACDDYENYKMNYIAGTAGKAILTPFSPGGDSIQSDMWGHRGRYFDYRY
jgi:hypothetical protein